MSISSSDINSIVHALQDSDWDEAVVAIGDVHISVARNGARLNQIPSSASQSAAVPVREESAPPATVVSTTPMVAASPVAFPAPTETVSDSTDFVLTAPSVGVVWRASEPGAAPFLEIGTRVDPEDTACIVEIMKLMNNVAVGVSGTVTAIHVENGQSVEFGAPLFSIRPDAS
ncbi:biotin/lipoyl-binding protein [Cryobacterium sp. TMS1-20-1]|uniref:acetyl-CoA carboxylase biotin carboxyl carrier protein n=1 Tax=Cryobacterium sp. TMS1-20-1 TaxID=1259223 RepID=UPI00106BB47B|nr:biotin/lipoyl-containing protein [Cryobacterium sp. TMS1-20-1]TFC70967.1 biotin/lipoyl-binding protein [Cryobacterium sp. TMS1-20-1]